MLETDGFTDFPLVPAYLYNSVGKSSYRRDSTVFRCFFVDQRVVPECRHQVGDYSRNAEFERARLHSITQPPERPAYCQIRRQQR